MPFFGGKFRHSKSPVRKKLNFHVECPRKDIKKDPLVLKVGGEEFKFESGGWKPANSDGVDFKKELENQKKISQELKEENNLLKIKLEILLDMLTLETTKALERKSKMPLLEEAGNRKL
uniref:Protein chibby 1 n=1 Tax=Lygus hesperus TaxID=30085 RepID=A0A0A9X3U0_LYGHE